MKAFPLALLLGLSPVVVRGQSLDRDTPVPAGPAHSFNLPPLQESQLKTGLRLALVEVRRLPLVSLRLAIPLAGSAYDPADKAGLASFVATLMTEGTKTKDSRRFAEAMDDLGATIGVSVSPDAMVVTVFTVKENLDKAMGLAAEMVRAPALPAKEFARVKEEALAGVQQQKGEPGALAEKRLSGRIFGAHPYGGEADEASLKAVTLGDVKSFQAAHVRPEGAVLSAAGDVDLAELQALALKHFGAWKGAPGAAPIASVPALPETSAAAGPAKGMTIEIIDMPGAQQSAIRAGHRSIARDDPDYFPVAVMNFLLGQAPILSRLDHNLREAHGWAYGAGSTVDAMKKGGSFVVEADVQTDATAAALSEILKELQSLRDVPVPDEELATAKRLMAGLFVLRQQTVQSIAAQVGGIELYGLPKDALAAYRDKVLAVTPADVQRVARAHLRAGDLSVVISGDAAKVRGGLGRIAPVTVYDVDGHPEVPAKPGTEAPKSSS